MKTGEADLFCRRVTEVSENRRVKVSGGITSRNGQSIQREIKRMVRRIVREFHPERVILFGSHARGEAGPDSDVDLLVVMAVDGLKREKAVAIRVALHDVRIAKDIIVTTPEDFAWRKDVPGTIEYPAVKEGKVLYVRN